MLVLEDGALKRELRLRGGLSNEDALDVALLLSSVDLVVKRGVGGAQGRSADISSDHFTLRVEARLLMESWRPLLRH